MSKAKELMKLMEGLKTKVIDEKEFPNPLTQSFHDIFLKKGIMDDNLKDDIVKSSDKEYPVEILKPTQNAIYLGHSLMMTQNGKYGGDLEAILSNDKPPFILDGHHRWASTMFYDPSMEVEGVQIELSVGDLVPILRAIGDAFKKKRRGGGKDDINIFQAKPDDLRKVLEDNVINSEWYDKEKVEKMLQEIGGYKVLEERLKMIQKRDPGNDMPPRDEMPVIDGNQLKEVRTMLLKGMIDIKKPYAKVKLK